MLPAIKAEFRKLFTVRSTYVIVGFMVLLTLIFAGYTEGFKAKSDLLGSPNHLATEVRNAMSAVTVFCGLIAILLFSHEYRYNTIMHTLTSVNRRSKVLLAKIIVMTAFAVGYGLFFGSLAPFVSYLGIQLAGHELAAQTIPYGDLLWRGLFFVWGYAMIGLLLVALTRNQIFSVVALFFIPITIEQILGMLLKNNAIYLPFQALDSVLRNSHDLAPKKAAITVIIWLISIWLIAWLLFIRRDATNSRG